MVKPDDRWLDTVPFLPFMCPGCGHEKPRTYRVERRDPVTRYHQCPNCQRKYRSEQVTRAELRWWVGQTVDVITPFLPVTCPACRSLKPRTYSVKRDEDGHVMRYHTCQNCRGRYRSIQLRMADIGRWSD